MAGAGSRRDAQQVGTAPGSGERRRGRLGGRRGWARQARPGVLRPAAERQGAERQGAERQGPERQGPERQGAGRWSPECGGGWPGRGALSAVPADRAGTLRGALGCRHRRRQTASPSRSFSPFPSPRTAQPPLAHAQADGSQPCAASALGSSGGTSSSAPDLHLVAPAGKWRWPQRRAAQGEWSRFCVTPTASWGGEGCLHPIASSPLVSVRTLPVSCMEYPPRTIRWGSLELWLWPALCFDNALPGAGGFPQGLKPAVREKCAKPSYCWCLEPPPCSSH